MNEHATVAGFDPAFKVLAGQTAPQSGSGSGTGEGQDVFLVEARQIGAHLKEALVEEGAGGPVWRLASDEGLHLHGTDLAPFPLGFFNAGLQADLQHRIAESALRHGLAVDALSLSLVTEYSLSGSFTAGTGQGFADGVEVTVEITSPAARAQVEAVLREAVAASPAFALLQDKLENTFSLVCNGRRRDPATLNASTAPTPADPFLKYTKAPVRLDEAGALAHPVVRTADQTPDTPAIAGSARNAAGRIGWKVNGSGSRDLRTGLYQSRVALNRAGNTVFALASDDSGRGRAPTGLSYLSAAIAFCYMTQLSRYIDGMKLPIRNVRLVQMLPWGVKDGKGQAYACDTHLFMQGESDEEGFETLQRIAATTCYLHRSMEAATPVTIALALNGTQAKPLPL